MFDLFHLAHISHDVGMHILFFETILGITQILNFTILTSFLSIRNTFFKLSIENKIVQNDVFITLKQKILYTPILKFSNILEIADYPKYATF